MSLLKKNDFILENFVNSSQSSLMGYNPVDLYLIFYTYLYLYISQRKFWIPYIKRN